MRWRPSVGANSALVWWPALLVALLAVLPETLQARLAWDRAAIDGGEYWRLWSGHFVHWSAAHALSNGLLLVVLGFCLDRAGAAGSRRRFAAWPLFVAPLLLSLALPLLAPAMENYRGASGLVAMLAVALCVDAWISRSDRLLGAVLLGALLLKTGLEGAGVGLASSLPAGVAVAWPVHVLGGLAGAGWAVWRRRRAPPVCPA
jgi:rhomboid family GlyGly-CTERM serine protease